jgi:hypothetical protein
VNRDDKLNEDLTNYALRYLLHRVGIDHGLYVEVAREVQEWIAANHG